MKEVTFPAGWLAQDVARAAQRQTEWRDAVPAAQTRDGEAMSDKIPQTVAEIAAAIKAVCLLCLPNIATEHLAKEVLRWRDAWLRATVPLTHEEALRLLVSDIRSLGSPPEQLLVALAKAEEALAGGKP